MAAAIASLRRAYERRIKAILSEQIAPLFRSACEVTGPVYMGPGEGAPDPSWWLMVRRAGGDAVQDVIFEIARLSSYDEGVPEGVAFGLRMGGMGGRTRILSSSAPSRFRDAADEAGLDADLAAFEKLPYAQLLREQGWLDIAI